MNAKDLSLAKINAGPKMFGFYAYGISLGIDIRDLSKIINSTQGRIINKLCEGNVFNNQLGSFSALLAINKLEGKGIINDLNQFNVIATIAEKNDHGEIIEIYPSGIDFEKYDSTKRTATQVLEKLIGSFYVSLLKNDNIKSRLKKFPNTTNMYGGINQKVSLDNMLYQLSLLGKWDDCIKECISNNNYNWITVENTWNAFENSDDWKASIYLLLEYCKNYSDTIQTYYEEGQHSYNKDLKILAQGAEEMRNLGSILQSNKTVKSKINEGLDFIKVLEESVINRKKIMNLKESENDKIDFILFCTDPKYREEAILKYEEVKHSINILDVVANSPHFYSYLRTNSIPYATFKVGSAKFRAIDKYYTSIVKGLNVLKKSDKDKISKNIEALCNESLLKKWLHEEKLYFLLPKDSLLFKNRNETVITKEDLFIPLWDWEGNGLATFKYYMEHTVIPKLIDDKIYAKNTFVQGLTIFGFNRTSTHNEIPAYTLEGNMMPNSESEKIQLLNYLADFSYMYDKKFTESPDNIHNSIVNYADAFYIYSQYVYEGKKGLRSLMSLFDDGECILSKHFEMVEADLDLNSDYDFSTSTLFIKCAPNDNIYKPLSKMFYSTDNEKFGTELYEVVESNSEDTDKKSVRLVFEKRPVITILNYISHKTNSPKLTENKYKLGKNINIKEEQWFENIQLTEDNADLLINIVPNHEGGTYSVVANDYTNERESKIINLINSKLNNIIRPILDLKTKTYYNTIYKNDFIALLTEAIKTIDKEC